MREVFVVWIYCVFSLFGVLNTVSGCFIDPDLVQASVKAVQYDPKLRHYEPLIHTNIHEYRLTRTLKALRELHFEGHMKGLRDPAGKT
jgi:hypothetical protein